MISLTIGYTHPFEIISFFRIFILKLGKDTCLIGSRVKEYKKKNGERKNVLIIIKRLYLPSDNINPDTLS